MQAHAWKSPRAVCDCGSNTKQFCTWILLTWILKSQQSQFPSYILKFSVEVILWREKWQCGAVAARGMLRERQEVSYWACGEKVGITISHWGWHSWDLVFHDWKDPSLSLWKMAHQTKLAVKHSEINCVWNTQGTKRMKHLCAFFWPCVYAPARCGWPSHMLIWLSSFVVLFFALFNLCTVA